MPRTDMTSIDTGDGNFIDVRYAILAPEYPVVYFAQFRFSRLHEHEEGTGPSQIEAVDDLYRCRRDLQIAHTANGEYKGQRRPLSPHERDVLCELLSLSISGMKHVVSPPPEISTLTIIKGVFSP